LQNLVPVIFPATWTPPWPACARRLVPREDAPWVALATVAVGPGDAQGQLLPDLEELSAALGRAIPREHAEHLAAGLLEQRMRAEGVRLQRSPRFPGVVYLAYGALAASALVSPGLLADVHHELGGSECFAAIPVTGTALFVGPRANIPALREAIAFAQANVPPEAAVSRAVFQVRNGAVAGLENDVAAVDTTQLLPAWMPASWASGPGNDAARRLRIPGLPDDAQPWLSLVLPTKNDQAFDHLLNGALSAFTFEQAESHAVKALEQRFVARRSAPEPSPYPGILQFVHVGLAASALMLPNLLKLVHQMLGSTELVASVPGRSIAFFAGTHLTPALRDLSSAMFGALAEAERLLPATLLVRDAVMVRGELAATDHRT
jgi:hypothetical protein